MLGVATTSVSGTARMDSLLTLHSVSDEANLLVLVYVYREPDIIRVLSAWRADRRRKQLYETGRS